MQLRTFAVATAALGLAVVAPVSATAADTCNEGVVNPGTVVSSISGLGTTTGLQGALRPILTSQVAQNAAGAAASLEGEVKLERVCPDGL